jgi:hypothetical protein
VVALMAAARAAHRHPAVRSVLLAVASGVAFGMSSVFTKTVAVDWTDGIPLSDLPSLLAIGVFATAGMLLSQASYRGAGLAAPLAMLTVVNPVVAAAVGITMFGETFRYGTTGTVLALGCGVVAAGGLILLTTERISGEPHATAATGTGTGTGTGPEAVPEPQPAPELPVPTQAAVPAEEDTFAPADEDGFAPAGEDVLVPAPSRESAYEDRERAAHGGPSCPYSPVYGPFVPPLVVVRRRTRQVLTGPGAAGGRQSVTPPARR